MYEGDYVPPKLFDYGLGSVEVYIDDLLCGVIPIWYELDLDIGEWYDILCTYPTYTESAGYCSRISDGNNNSDLVL